MTVLIQTRDTSAAIAMLPVILCLHLMDLRKYNSLPLMRRAIRRVLPILLTAGFFYVVLRRIPYERLLAALGEADYFRFLALMIPNTVIYVAWDTFVLAVAVRWFHGPATARTNVSQAT